MQSLNEKLSQQFSNTLMGLLVKAEAKAVFLCDRGGNILSHSCAENYSHEDNIAALASGSFYATRVLALKAGQIVYDGPPADIDEVRFREIYGEDAVEVEIR